MMYGVLQVYYWRTFASIIWSVWFSLPIIIGYRILCSLNIFQPFDWLYGMLLYQLRLHVLFPANSRFITVYSNTKMCGICFAVIFGHDIACTTLCKAVYRLVWWQIYVLTIVNAHHIIVFMQRVCLKSFITSNFQIFQNIIHVQMLIPAVYFKVRNLFFMYCIAFLGKQDSKQTAS